MRLENQDYCVSAWRDHEGNIPLPDTLVTLQDLKEGRFVFLYPERKHLVETELQHLQNMQQGEGPPFNGMHLHKDPPNCVLCSTACHLGWSETWGKDAEGEFTLRFCKCPNCAMKEELENYARTKIITSTLCRRTYLEVGFPPKERCSTQCLRRFMLAWKRSRR